MKDSLSIKIKKISRKYQIPVAIVIGLVTFINAIFDISDKISSFSKSMQNTKTIPSVNLDDKNQIQLIIQKGETKNIFIDDIFLITVDRIIFSEITDTYKLYGKLDNGNSTEMLNEFSQGSSVRFNNYIIQTIKIASDYAEFKIIRK